MGAVAACVLAPETAPMPEELMTAHICEMFGCAPDVYEQHQMRYILWYALRCQEDMARQVKRKMDNNEQMSAQERDWRLEYEQYVPDQVPASDDVQAFKRVMGS